MAHVFSKVRDLNLVGITFLIKGNFLETRLKKKIFHKHVRTILMYID